MKTKYSVFQAPKDAKRLKEWEDAIPGGITLKPKAAICERHFEERLVIKRYIAHDSFGKVIADVSCMTMLLLCTLRIHTGWVPPKIDVYIQG